MKVVRIRSLSGPHFSAFGLNIPYLFVFSPNAVKYGPEKLRIRTLHAVTVASVTLHKYYLEPMVHVCTFTFYFLSKFINPVNLSDQYFQQATIHNISLNSSLKDFLELFEAKSTLSRRRRAFSLIIQILNFNLPVFSQKGVTFQRFLRCWSSF